MKIETSETRTVPPYDRPHWTAWSADLAVGDTCGALLASVVAPAWRRLCAGRAGDARPYLRIEWPAADAVALRLRLHVPPGLEEVVSRTLGEIASAQGIELRLAPDADAHADADRHLDLQTQADRLELGALSAIADRELVTRYRIGRECAADLQLAAIRGDAAPAYGDRQPLAARLILAALLRVLPDPERLAGYLTFHRDWLIRYPLLSGGYGRSAAQDLFALLDSQRTPGDDASSGSKVALSSLAARPDAAGPADAAAAAADAADADTVDTADAWEAWIAAVSDLAAALSARAGDSRYSVDPFASGPLFPGLFTLGHAVARQFGLDVMNEAALYHVWLGHLGQPGGAAQFCLAPHLDRIPETGAARAEAKTDGLREGEYPWREIVAHSGPEGRAWIDSYLQYDADIAKPLVSALYLLRQDKLREGADLLALTERRRQPLRDSAPGVFLVLGRFYYSELAYYKYRTGDLAGAEADMDSAARAASEAIDLHRFLLPLALPLGDIPLQKARIAKERRDWAEMRRLLDIMFDMEAGLRPLCVLRDGTGVDYALLDRYLSALALPEPERSQVAAVLRLDTRLDEFRRLTSRLVLLKHFVHLNALKAD